MKKLILLLFIATFLFSCSSSDSSAPAVVNNIKTDSAVALLKKDKSFEIKDAMFDSSMQVFRIAFTNKDNVLKEKDYSTQYFKNTYHLMDIAGVKGIYLYAYKPSKSFAAKPIFWESTYYTDFAGSNYKSDIESYLEKVLNDKTGLEIMDAKILNDNGDQTFTTKTIFRAKNPYGALMQHTIICDLGYKEGEVSIPFNVKLDK